MYRAKNTPGTEYRMLGKKVIITHGRATDRALMIQ